MISNTSNTNGRALEYCLVEELRNMYSGAYLFDKKTTEDQIRDKHKFDNLSLYQQEYFSKQSKKIIDWIKINRRHPENGTISLQRLSDDNAKSGDVTDITIRQGDYPPYNISLKHNHNAVKHQRPGGLYKQLGINDKELDKLYKQEIKNIEECFFQEILDKSITTFEDLKKTNATTILNLYKEICILVSNEINKLSTEENTRKLFLFLIGNKDYDKFIVSQENIQLFSFYNLPFPNLVQAFIQPEKENYLYLSFNNNYTFSLRIHTASKSFSIGKTISLKFDSQLIESSITGIYI